MTQMSPLRRRMIEDMTVRNLSPATQRSYISAVFKLSRYFGRSPEQLNLEDVRAFQVHLVSTGISWPALNQIVCALRSIRRECVDHFVVLGEAHLRRILRAYARYYNDIRTHRSLDNDAPVSRPVQRTEIISSHAILGGLHHHCGRV